MVLNLIKVLELFGEPILNGGQESFGINVVNALDSSEYHIDFLTPYNVNNREYEKILHQRNGKIYSLGLTFNPGGNKFNVFKPLKAFFKKNSYDIVHINSGSTFFLAVAAYVAKCANAKKVIVHSHSSGQSESIKHVLIKKIAALSFYKNADEICAPSLEAAKWKFSKRLINKKLRIIKNGIDTERFKFSSKKRNKIRNKLNIDKYLVLGHVGRFTAEKNQIFLIKLISQIRKDNIRLILIGDGEDFSLIKKEARKRKVMNKIIFLGRKSNPEYYLPAFDIFLLPSKYEGLGLVAIEAQCSGLPVIASNNVPKDINITPYVSFESLNNLQGWITLINKYSQIDRHDESDLVKQAGFDEKNLTRQMKKLYSFSN